MLVETRKQTLTPSHLSQKKWILSAGSDSIHCDESPEDPQPIQADESFDDFIYNFASDDVLQRQRVKFPLPYYNGDKKRISRSITGSMMTCLPNSIIIRFYLIEKKIWI